MGKFSTLHATDEIDENFPLSKISRYTVLIIAICMYSLNFDGESLASAGQSVRQYNQLLASHKLAIVVQQIFVRMKTLRLCNFEAF